MKALLSFIQTILEFLLALPFGIGPVINLSSSYFASFLRFYNGSYAANNLQQCNRPKKPLLFYQYEGCPYCRKVRECMSVLALDVVIYPCPRTTLSQYGVSSESSRFRPVATKLSGQCMFPLLVDENVTPRLVLLESADIINYLWKTYGDKATQPFLTKLANYGIFKYFLLLPSLLRPLPEMGIIRIPSHSPPSQMIELYGYDTCPRTRLIRELLDSLELPYFYHNTPPFNNSNGKQRMLSRYQELQGTKVTGVSTPLFIDQSKQFTAIKLDEILRHIRNNYQKGKVLDTKWSDYSTAGASEQHGVVPGFKKTK